MEVGIRNDLVFGTVSANDFGIYISGEGVYNAPSRDVELVDVPGRNGALIIDKKRYSNIPIEYPAFTFANSQAEFRRKLNAYKNAIMAQVGYQKLSDTYHPDEYRLGMFVEGLEFEPVHYGRAATFTLKFNCKPQRYLVDGDNEVTVTDGDVLVNPTLYDASPLLLVEGYGTINFNGYEIDLTNAGTYGTIEGYRYEGTVSGSSITQSYDYGYYLGNGDTVKLYVISKCYLTTTVASYTISDIDWSVAYSGEIRENILLSSCDTTSTTDALLTVFYTTDPTPTFTVGTATDETVTHTITFTLTDEDANTTTDTITVTDRFIFDGVSKVTFMRDVSDPDNYHIVTSDSIYVDIVFDDVYSSGLILGNPTYVDCELGECYKYEGSEVVDLNAYIDLGSDLPTLASGENEVTYDDTITSLIVVPRWWQL